MSYAFDEASTFRPLTTADLKPFGGAAKLTLKQSDTEMCETAPRFHITTTCFPYHWHAVAPIASNGWVLTGEVGKFIPVSNQRISSIQMISSGGFSLALRGAPGEAVTMGAAKVAAGGTVSYKTATIGSDGTAVLQLGGGGL